MAKETIISRLTGSTAAVRGCPCGNRQFSGKSPITWSIVMQLATLGAKRRVRAKAITMHLCESCVRLIMTDSGRKLRHSLAVAVQAMAVDIQRQRGGARATSN